MSVFLRLGCAAIGVLAYVDICWAGAWTQAKGEGLIISGTSFNQANLAFDSEGKLRTPVDFEKIDSTFFAEFGLTDKLTIVGSTALQDISYTSSQGPQRYNGFATSKVGMRYGLKSSSPWVFALQPSLVIPAGGEAVPDGDLGLGGFGAEMRVLAGRPINFGKRPGFINGEAAYDARSGGAPRQITADLTVGVKLADKVQLIGQGFYRHTNESLFERDVILANESLKLQASLVFDLPKIGLFKPKAGEDAAEQPRPKRGNTALQIGLFQGVAGRNIVREQGAMMTLWNTF